MARKSTGSIVEHEGRDGTTYHAIRFRAYGERQYVALGAVTRDVAERKLRHVLADVERGIWQPRQAAEAPPAPKADVTFHEYAEQWWAEHEREWLDSTQADYRWRLEKHLLPFFGSHRLGEITIAEVDRYKAAKLGRGTLGGESINKTLVTLSTILDTAEERELIPRNPARLGGGGGASGRASPGAPTSTPPTRSSRCSTPLASSTLRPGWTPARSGGSCSGALLAVYTFGGLRTGEALDLRRRDVDLAARRVRVGKAKTDAGAAATCSYPRRSATSWSP